MTHLGNCEVDDCQQGELRAEIERLEAEKTKLWQMRVAAENACDDLRAEIERLRAALEEIEYTTRHEIRRWDIANEIACRALEPKP